MVLRLLSSPLTAFTVLLVALAAPSGATAALKPEAEINDSMSMASGPVVSGDSWTGALQTGNDEDYFVVYTSSTTQVHITLTNTSPLDPDSSEGPVIDLNILDKFGSSDGFTQAFAGSLGETLDETISRGTHFVKVEGDTGSSDSGGSYRFDVSSVPPLIVGPPPSIKCIDPHLRGKTLRQARRALHANHCEVGNVHRARSRRRQYVYRQSGTPGFTYRTGHKISLRLRPHRRHHHRRR